MLLNTAISWGRGDNTILPLSSMSCWTRIWHHLYRHQQLHHSVGSSARKSQSLNQTSRQHQDRALLWYLSTRSNYQHAQLKGIFQGHLEHGATQLHVILGKCVYLVHYVNERRKSLLKVHLRGKQKNRFHLTPGSSTSITPKPSISLLAKPFTPCFILLLKINHL